MAGEFTCEECGRTFDSERGMKIHASQMHKDEEAGEPDAEDEQEISGKDSLIDFELSLTPQHVMIAFLLLGLTIGYGAGLATAGELEMPEFLQKATTSPVALEDTAYPYEGVNAGIGSSIHTTDNGTYNLSGEPYVGAENAQVTVVAYEDFECPFCNRYNNRAFPQIMSNYVENNKVKYYLKNFPLARIHPWAVKGGIASECALNQDEEAFWIFKEGFFNNQDRLSQAYSASPELFDKSMKKWAAQANLDQTQFNNCYDEQRELDEVRSDQREGSEDGVSGTPTIFIEDQKITGAQPFQVFKQVIDSKLE